MKKIIILFLISFTATVFAKVEKIYDEFDGTYYYQTDSVIIRDYNAWQMLEYRFRTTKEKENHKIILELSVVGDVKLITVDKDTDAVRIRCSNEHTIILNYESIFSSTGNGFSWAGNQPQSIRTHSYLTDIDIEAINSGISMIRVETEGRNYKNLLIKEKDSKKFINKLNELIKKLDTDK